MKEIGSTEADFVFTTPILDINNNYVKNIKLGQKYRLEEDGILLDLNSSLTYLGSSSLIFPIEKIAKTNLWGWAGSIINKNISKLILW
jgi:hypothetical protein